MRKQTKKQLQDFNTEVVDILEFYGAKRADSNTNYFDRIMYEMNSDKLGRLVITLGSEPSRVYTIFTRFEEPEKAKKYFNCNPHSGKHNSHELTPEPCLTFIDSLLDNYNQINGINSHEEYMKTMNQ